MLLHCYIFIFKSINNDYHGQLGTCVGKEQISESRIRLHIFKLSVYQPPEYEKESEHLKERFASYCATCPIMISVS
jgi:hypothetical protein